MRRHFFCYECMSDAGIVYCTVETNEEDAYAIECPNGHSIFMSYGREKYETLGEMAIGAAIDGYYLQAVSTISTALERFYEYYIRVVYYEKFQSTALFDALWAKVKSQSERQLGIFLSMYATEEHRLPSILTNKQIELRNDTVHKGVIPTQEEAFKFIQAVIKIIAEHEDLTKKKYSVSCERLHYQNLENVRKILDISHDVVISVQMINSPFRVYANGGICSDITSILDYFSKMKRVTAHFMANQSPPSAA